MRTFIRNRARPVCVAAAATIQTRRNTTTFSPEELAGFSDIPPPPPKGTGVTAASEEVWGDEAGGWDNEAAPTHPQSTSTNDPAQYEFTEGESYSEENTTNAASNEIGGWSSLNDTGAAAAGGRWGSGAPSKWGAAGAGDNAQASSWGGQSAVANTLEESEAEAKPMSESELNEVFGEEESSVEFNVADDLEEEISTATPSSTTAADLAAAIAATVAVTGGSAALQAVEVNNRKAKRVLEDAKRNETVALMKGAMSPRDLVHEEEMDLDPETQINLGIDDGTSSTVIIKKRTTAPNLGDLPNVGAVKGPIDISAKYDPRLASVPRASVEAILALQPEDAVTFASDYVHMQHFIRSCRRRQHNIVNPIFLSTLKEEALLSVAIKAIEDKAVPIEKAIDILGAPYLFERLRKYRRYLATLMRSWTVEIILAEKLTPAVARKILHIASHFGRDARVIGALSQKAIVDLAELSNAQIVAIMYGIADTYVKPPAAFWSLILRQLAKNVNESRTSEAENKVNTSTAGGGDVEAPRKRDPKALTPRQIYRILDVCARVGVHSDINMLAQLSEHAWRQIASRATECQFPDKPLVRHNVALRRLFRVSELGPQQFFRLVQLTSTLGTNFKAGQGVITDKVLIPLCFHLNDHHVSEYIEAISMSKSRYGPAIQAIIDRVVYRGAKSPAALMHVSRILRSISRHNDICAQLRLAKFFELLEQLCSHQQVLRTIQMTRLIEDIYYITRRFSRSAPIVIRMQCLVENFAHTLIPALNRGVAAIDQINAVLEHTVMLGMSKDGEKFPNVKKLRDLRKEIYANTKPGSFPVGYRDRCDPSVRFLYNELIFVNQSQVLFQQQVDRSALIQLQQLIAAAGPYNVLSALYIYNELHGTTLPLSPFLQSLLMKYFQHTMREIKTGQSVQTISKHLRLPRNKVLTTSDLHFFANATKRKSLANLKSQTFYLEFLNAASVALGGNEEVQSLVNSLQTAALY